MNTLTVQVHKGRMGRFVGRMANQLRALDVRASTGKVKTTDELIDLAANQLGIRQYEFFRSDAKKEMK